MTDSPHPHIPEELPVEGVDLGGMISQVVEANKALARFDGHLEGIQNPRVLLSPLMTQEAVVSSKIEGTQATLEDVLEHEADQGQPEEQRKREDVEEIINYRSALTYGEQKMAERPFNLNLLKGMHSILMDGVRGQNKCRGEFRKMQIHIGPSPARIDAVGGGRWSQSTRYGPEIESLEPRIPDFGSFYITVSLRGLCPNEREDVLHESPRPLADKTVEVV